MPLGDQLNIDPATSGTPQVLASELISSKEYQGILICDASGNIVGSTANPMMVRQSDGTNMAALANAAPASTAYGLVTRPIVSGTQAIQHRTTQMVNSFVERVVGSATEAMLSMNTRVGIAAPGAAAAAIPITTGRGLRITSIVLQYLVINATTPPWISVRLRHNSAAGTIATTNHLVNNWYMGPPVQVVGTFTQLSIPLPEGGIDIPSAANAQAVGFSMVASATTPANGNIGVTMVAHEYTP